jgi:hypothetical protein
MSSSELVEYLRKIATYEATDSHWDAPAAINSHDKCVGAARVLGKELHARGGAALLRQVFAELRGCPGARNIDLYWDGIGEWQG